MAENSQSGKDFLKPRTSAITAIVISYFTGPVLARSLSSLREQTEIGEIILIDNGNFAGAVTAAVEESSDGAPVQIISGQGNIGFAAACNLGATAARHDYLLFFNPDAVMPAGGAERMLKDAAKLTRPWLMGAKLVDPDGTEQQGSRRETLTPWRAFVEASRIYKLAPRHPYFRRFNLHALECPKDITPTPTISGACFLLHKEDYTAIDGMDERYFLHVEDVDFCLRFANAGGAVYFNPNVSVMHFKSSSRANPVKIEVRKVAGVILYFNTHFADAYPRVFLWLVAGLLWLSFGLLFVRRAIGKLIRLAGICARTGMRGIARARAISARRSSR
jgi:GT2 family glycosyltransferase